MTWLGAWKVVRLCRIGAPAVHETRQSRSGSIAQFLGQEISGKILVADRSQETANGKRTDRCRAAVGGSGKWSTMYHRVPHLDPRRPAVGENPPSLSLEDGQQPARNPTITRLHVQGCGQLALQRLRHRHERFDIGAAHDQRRRSEYLVSEARI